MSSLRVDRIRGEGEERIGVKEDFDRVAQFIGPPGFRREEKPEKKKQKDGLSQASDIFKHRALMSCRKVGRMHAGGDMLTG